MVARNLTSAISTSSAADKSGNQTSLAILALTLSLALVLVLTLLVLALLVLVLVERPLAFRAGGVKIVGRHDYRYCGDRKRGAPPLYNGRIGGVSCCTMPREEQCMRLAARA